MVIGRYIPDSSTNVVRETDNNLYSDEVFLTCQETMIFQSFILTSICGLAGGLVGLVGVSVVRSALR